MIIVLVSNKMPMLPNLVHLSSSLRNLGGSTGRNSILIHTFIFISVQSPANNDREPLYIYRTDFRKAEYHSVIGKLNLECSCEYLKTYIFFKLGF